MTEDFCKLASGIILSTIWREDDHTRILWITMLAVKDRYHNVYASVPGLAAVANLPVESVRASLEKLMDVDRDSRSDIDEGRRIRKIDGGWFIINGEKYRNYLSRAERNEYQAKLMSTRRAKAKMLAPVRNELALLAQAEAEADKRKVQKENVKLASMVAAFPPDFGPEWLHFLEHRKKKKAPMTDHAQELLLSILAKRPTQAVEAIRTAMSQGWTGFKWSWIDKENASKPKSGRSVL